MEFAELSFTGLDTSGEYPKVMPWNPRRTGDHGKDCAIGRAYFEELLQHMEQKGNPLLLLRVINAQVQAGTWESIEIGFTQAMSERLLLAPRH